MLMNSLPTNAKPVTPVVEGLIPSTLRDLTRKLTIVPAGHAYREAHEP